MVSLKGWGVPRVVRGPSIAGPRREDNNGCWDEPPGSTPRAREVARAVAVRGPGRRPDDAGVVLGTRLATTDHPRRGTIPEAPCPQWTGSTTRLAATSTQPATRLGPGTD